MLVHKGSKIKNWGGECRDVTPTKSLSQNIRVDVNRDVKIKKKKKIGWVGLGGGQSGCERRIEVFVKIKKKKKLGWGREGEGSGLGGQGGFDQRIEKFLGKFTKKGRGGWFGGGGGGGGAVRVDVNEELKFLSKFKKK